MSIENPSWHDFNDRQLFEELFYNNKNKENKQLTKEEKDFCTTMYHYEEYASGLDG